MAAIFRPIAAVSPHPKHISAATRAPAIANAVVCSMMEKRKFPVFLFDVMDTIVRDPFYHDIPAFFKMSMKELLDEKHPTAWVEFEKGFIDETELAKKFFKDGRPFDLEEKDDHLPTPRPFDRLHDVLGVCVDTNRVVDFVWRLILKSSIIFTLSDFVAGLKECLRRGYSYVDGIEELLHVLKQNNYELHAFTNYPVWYKMIEEKLKLSKYLSWTFSSCIIGKRKPAPDSYAEVIHRLNIEPASCIFIDDRVTNVEAAVNAGMVGIHFKNSDSLKQDLSLVGVELGVFNRK